MAFIANIAEKRANTNPPPPLWEREIRGQTSRQKPKKNKEQADISSRVVKEESVLGSTSVTRGRKPSPISALSLDPSPRAALRVFSRDTSRFIGRKQKLRNVVSFLSPGETKLKPVRKSMLQERPSWLLSQGAPWINLAKGASKRERKNYPRTSTYSRTCTYIRGGKHLLEKGWREVKMNGVLLYKSTLPVDKILSFSTETK